MDTSSMPPPVPLPLAMPRLLDQVLTGGDAVLEGPGAPAALEAAAAPLAAGRCRVLRASAAGPGGLGMSGLMAQVTGQQDLSAQDDASLEQGTQALTRLDEGCDRVALLLDGAVTMPPMTLRYLQLACRTSASLRLVLAGRPDALDEVEFAYLRTRLAARPVLVLDAPSGTPGLTASPADRPKPTAVPPGWTRPAAAAAVAAMAACVGLGVLIGRLDRVAAPDEAKMSAIQPAALPSAPLSGSDAAVPAVLAVPAFPVPAPTPPIPDAAPATPAASQPAGPLPLPPVPPTGRTGGMVRQADARPPSQARRFAAIPRPAQGRAAGSTRSPGQVDAWPGRWEDIAGPVPDWRLDGGGWPSHPGAYTGRGYSYDRSPYDP